MFGLSDLHLQQLPVLRVPPREYWPENYDQAQTKGCSLVSTIAAGNLAVALGLSHIKLEEPEEVDDERFLSHSLEDPPAGKHYGMATIRFPSVSRHGVVEAGVWCNLCQVANGMFAGGHKPRHVLGCWRINILPFGGQAAGGGDETPG
jgi:hypothetical protein